MTFWEGVLLVAGGLAAGVVNTMAGGGSLLTVPLLVLAGVPGNVANGSNRVGVVVSMIVATLSFRSSGLDVARSALPAVAPVVVGSVIGATVISQVTDDAFETIFGILMIPLLVVTFWPSKAETAEETRSLGSSSSMVVFFLVGLYGGAVQAGVGLVLIAVLSRLGYDLVKANALKVVINLSLAASALPVFIANDQVDWGPAALLAVGFAGGGFLGARFTVKGGERLIRPVLLLAVVALSGRLLGLW